jgi:hypothetical protein
VNGLGIPGSQRAFSFRHGYAPAVPPAQLLERERATLHHVLDFGNQLCSSMLAIAVLADQRFVAYVLLGQHRSMFLPRMDAPVRRILNGLVFRVWQRLGLLDDIVLQALRSRDDIGTRFSAYP